MLSRLPRSLRIFALSACLAASSSVACSSESDEAEPSATTGSGSGGKGGSKSSGNAAGEEGEGEGGEPGSGSGSGAEGGGDSSSGGTDSTGGTDSRGGRGGTGGSDETGGTGGTDPSGGTGGTDPGPDLEAIARGKTLAESEDANCSGCHGVNPAYAGGPPYHAGNITPDVETGLGSWSDVEIAAAVRDGIGKDGEQLCSTMMKFDFDDDQMRDLIAFLRSLDPVSKAKTGVCQ